jgi:hypothetical protein
MKIVRHENREGKGVEEMKYWFKFTINDKILRKMDRRTYYATMSWFRSCRRKVEKELGK